MRARNNYYEDIERQVQELLKAVGHTRGPLSHHVAADIAEHLGFSLQYVGDLPHSTRSVTDLKNHRIYLTQQDRSDHDPRAVLLQAVGHYVLGHRTPKDYADFLRQRVYTNYFAAALLMPEKDTVAFLREAKATKELAIEDIRDAFAVSYETAAHRFTNLATQISGHPHTFPEGPRQRHHPQGLRERRRELPRGPHRRHRGPAGVPVLDVAGRL